MTYKSKTDFTKQHNLRQLGIVEYCSELEMQGLTENQIQGKMMIDNVVRSPRAVQESFSFYKSVAKHIGWIK